MKLEETYLKVSSLTDSITKVIIKKCLCKIKQLNLIEIFGFQAFY